jgi:hypothetical protein
MGARVNEANPLDGAFAFALAKVAFLKNQRFLKTKLGVRFLKN